MWQMRRLRMRAPCTCNEMPTLFKYNLIARQLGSERDEGTASSREGGDVSPERSSADIMQIGQVNSVPPIQENLPLFSGTPATSSKATDTDPR
ncbi:hypothetical protein AAFF_G00278910 [Aldrovandia affinis]|uniref:Uncharacterized protein n=1 Tax=Aldrovandia affinis TaxID=143900 RepID=A0AAD7SSE1_9TELE|nr:hypothetical protein AAFF_G00278910 [Aldrovandia affinis]